jgi:hypothetical protein
VANPYDDALKALWPADLAGLCRWLGVPVEGEPVRLAESVPAATTRAVDLLVSVRPGRAVHIEFQTRPERRFPWRMLDYRVRLSGLRDLAGSTIEQHAVLLGAGRLAAGIDEPGLSFSYAVHHLQDEDPEQFLAEPALAPFASLARLSQGARSAVLARALQLIATAPDRARRETFVRATVNLAELYLAPATIESIREDHTMPLPTGFDDYLRDKAREAGLEGRELELEQGRKRGLEQAAESLLRVRFGDDPLIGHIARRLARLGAEACMRRIEAAADLDELA